MPDARYLTQRATSTYMGNNNGTTFKHVDPRAETRGETRGDTAEERHEGDTSLDVFLV